MTFEGRIEVNLSWRELPVWLYVAVSPRAVSVTDPAHAPKNPAIYSGGEWERPLDLVFGGAYCVLCAPVQECLQNMLEACQEGLMTQQALDRRCAEISRVTQAVTRALERNRLLDPYL